MSITVARLKKVLYIESEDTDVFDEAIEELIKTITAAAIEYLDNEDITEVSDFSVNLERSLCKQITYEFRRRKDLGLASHGYPNGSIDKMEIDEWLPDVKKALDRKCRYAL